MVSSQKVDSSPDKSMTLTSANSINAPFTKK